MKKITLLLTLLITSNHLFAFNTIYQAGNITSLTRGIYSSDITLKNLEIKGKFSKIHARTIPPAKKGYTLSQWIAKNQKFHDLKNVEGTMIGIYSPKYLSNIAVPGFHFHFITKDLSHVYHVYSFESAQVNTQIEKMNNFTIMLPDTKEYQNATIETFSHDTISKMEEGR